MSNRSDCVIIQQASGPYIELLKLGLNRHLAYAQRHRMDYWPVMGESRYEGFEMHAYWEKAHLVNQAFDAGYEKVIWLDSDVLITGDDDLRKAIEEAGNGIGAVWHAMQWGDDRLYDHFNAGVLFFGKRAEDFVCEWLGIGKQGGVKHPWHDQHALNQLAKSHPGVVQEISRYWHSTYPHHMHEEGKSRPMVLAWHGYGSVEQRKAAMQAYLLREENPDMVPAIEAAQNADPLKVAQEYEAAGQYAKALAIYKSMLRESRNEPNLLQRAAGASIGLGEFGQAEKLLREALAYDPKHADCWRQLGGVLSHTGREAESVACIEKSLELAPYAPVAQWNMSLAELRAGKVEEGLSRWKWGYVTGGRRQRTVACPEWDGTPNPNGTLFVWAEQGYGDTIMFCRFLQEAQEQFEGEVVCEVQSELVALLQDYGGVRIVSQTADFSLPCSPTAHISLMELPRVLKTDRHYSDHVPYIFHDESVRSAEDFRRMLDKPGLNVGVCWAGSRTHHNDRMRSLDMEELLGALIEVEGVNLTSLQQGKDTFGGLNDWTDTAAAMQCLDLVITVDTGVAHLAGAMGKPVWILLAAGSDWRWGVESEESLWYPSARLFRQTRFAQWGDVLECVACELTKLAGEANEPLRIEASNGESLTN